jgi:hypothetical protein
MNKSTLLPAIKKVFLDLKGADEYHIFWNLKNNKLILSSYVVAFGSTTVSTVCINELDMEDSFFIIREPKKLLNLLNIKEEELNMTIDKNVIKIKDSNFTSTFILCDPDSVSQRVPDIDEPGQYDLMVKLNEGFSDRFLKAKKANNSEIFSVLIEKGILKYTVGDDNSYSNQISFTSNGIYLFDMSKLLFSSDIIEEIFERNKDAEGTMVIFADGLMKIEFEDSKIKSKYYLIALDTL